MRCYICDYSDNGCQSSYNLGLSDKRKTKTKVKLTHDNKWLCDNCDVSSNSSIRQLKRIHEPLNPDNYRKDITKLLKEFKEDCPDLYDLLEVDSIPVDPDFTVAAPLTYQFN